MSKTITLSEKDLLTATTTGSKLKIHEDKKLEEKIKMSPNLGCYKRKGAEIESIILRTLRKKERTSASWLHHHLGLALRTAGYALIRLEKQGLATSKYEHVMGKDGVARRTNVFTITKKGKTWKIE